MVRGQRYGSRSKILFEVKEMVRGQRWFEVEKYVSRSMIWFVVKYMVQGQRYGSRSKIRFEVKDTVRGKRYGSR